MTPLVCTPTNTKTRKLQLTGVNDWLWVTPKEAPQKPQITNPGTTPITILAVNSDHGLSFAGEETRTMVWVSFSLQINSTIRHENITYPKKIFSNYFPITVSRFRFLRINIRKLPDTYCICVSCVTLPGWDPCPCRIIFITVTRFEFFRINWVTFSWQMVLLNSGGSHSPWWVSSFYGDGGGSRTVNQRRLKAQNPLPNPPEPLRRSAGLLQKACPQNRATNRTSRGGEGVFTEKEAPFSVKTSKPLQIRIALHAIRRYNVPVLPVLVFFLLFANKTQGQTPPKTRIFPTKPPEMLGKEGKNTQKARSGQRSTTTRDRNLQFRGAVSTGGSPLDCLLFLQYLCAI